MNDIDRYRYYDILGLQPGASEEEVRRAYRDLILVWHPDRFAGNPRLQQKAEEKLKEINEAYKQLEYLRSVLHGGGFVSDLPNFTNSLEAPLLP